MKRKLLAVTVTMLAVMSLVGCDFTSILKGGKGNVSQVDVVPDPIIEVEPVEPVVEPEVKPEVEPEVEPEIEPEVEPEVEPVVEPPVVTGYVSPELSDDVYAYQISIDGVVFQLPLYVKEFESMGWKPETRLGTSVADDSIPSGYYNMYDFAKSDKEKITAYVMNFDVNEIPAEEGVIVGFKIDSFTMKEGDISLPGGIKFNESTIDDIKEKYGEPSRDNVKDDYTSMEYSEGSYNLVKFMLYKDKNYVVDNVEIKNFVEPEGFVQGEVDTTSVPEFVQAYVAPTEFSDNPEDFIVEIEGDLYKLPCPVQEFVNNGWTVVEKSSESIIEGNGYGKVTLRKNNYEFWDFVVNYDSNATTVENCFVQDFTIRNQSANISVKIAGGVEYNQDADAAFKILEPLGFTKDEKYFVLKYEYGKEYSCYVSNGKIKDISVTHKMKRKDLAKELGIE